MAKKDNTAAVENTEGTAAVEAPSRGKKVMLTAADGTQIARADYIKQRFAELGPQSRSAIRKELKDLFNHDVPYQIVFAATKPAKAKADTPAEASAESVAA